LEFFNCKENSPQNSPLRKYYSSSTGAGSLAACFMLFHTDLALELGLVDSRMLRRSQDSFFLAVSTWKKYTTTIANRQRQKKPKQPEKPKGNRGTTTMIVVKLIGRGQAGGRATVAIREHISALTNNRAPTEGE
jgi:hypothetical protein